MPDDIDWKAERAAMQRMDRHSRPHDEAEAQAHAEATEKIGGRISALAERLARWCDERFSEVSATAGTNWGSYEEGHLVNMQRQLRSLLTDWQVPAHEPASEEKTHEHEDRHAQHDIRFPRQPLPAAERRLD